MYIMLTKCYNLNTVPKAYFLLYNFEHGTGGRGGGGFAREKVLMADKL